MKARLVALSALSVPSTLRLQLETALPEIAKTATAPNYVLAAYMASAT